MGELIPILGGRIIDAGVAATLVSGTIALAMVVTRQPSRRRALARAGVVGTLLVIPLIIFRPFAPVDLLAPFRHALQPFLDGLSKGAPRWAAEGARYVGPSLLIAYAAGVALSLARLALGWFGSGWIGRNSQPPSPGSETLYRDLPCAEGRPRPALRVSSRTIRPVLVGTFRPTILIPPGLDRPDSTAPLRLALLHELAHNEGADPWFGLANELASVVWFWLPPLRWIGRQMRLDQEFLADRRAADRLGTSSRYASTLVEIAASASRTGVAAAPPEGTGSALLQRVQMLIRCPFPIEVRPPRWWRGALGMATVLVLLLATGLTLRARSQPATSSGPRLLAMAHLALQAAGDDVSDTVLPVRLPPDFNLEFEVSAETEELPLIHILGRPLSSPPRAGNGTHRIVLRRRGAKLTLGIDGGPMVSLSTPSSDEWLSARGLPHRPTVLRSLRLSW